MAYYCFLCNDNHEDPSTEEHFIPRSINGPEHQWLPVCEDSNVRSNSVFDNDARDILYWVRFQSTRALKRSGEALLRDGTLKRFNFAYHNDLEPESDTAFGYIYDRETNVNIVPDDVYAIAFPVGLVAEEREKYCRGLAKISIGALAYLLKRQGVEDQVIRQIFLQTPVEAVRRFALNLPWPENADEIRFSLGRSDVLTRLQRSCENSLIRNHVISISFQEENSIRVEGMLYSQYGWVLDLSNRIAVEDHELRLENPIADMDAPMDLRDVILSPDSICIVNPDYIGQTPVIPQHWRAS